MGINYQPQLVNWCNISSINSIIPLSPWAFLSLSISSACVALRAPTMAAPWPSLSTKFRATFWSEDKQLGRVIPMTCKLQQKPWLVPWKINMEHDHRGLVQIIVLSKMGDFVGSSRSSSRVFWNNESYLTPPKS